MTEKPKLIKGAAVLTTAYYKTPKTMPMLFHFEANPFKTSLQRLRECKIQYETVEGKDVYILDDFFPKNESEELREYSQKAKFSRSIFASNESRESGEEPARCMNNQEKWEFFSNPPQAINEVYKLFSMLAHQMDADVTTLPWDLCDKTICAPAVATNRLEKVTSENMALGKHQDYNTETGLSFGIPVLYSTQGDLHPNHFENGELSRPWLISAILYSSADNFLPEYGMGTAFYKKSGEQALRTDCLHMRLVLFEGDIFHSIEQSFLPSTVSTWRVSYVFKLTLNPRIENQSLKKRFADLLARACNSLNEL